MEAALHPVSVSCLSTSRRTLEISASVSGEEIAFRARSPRGDRGQREEIDPGVFYYSIGRLSHDLVSFFGGLRVEAR